jgi:hypothetical protein
MDGYGIFTWIDKRQYKGYYLEDRKHGFGRFYWPDGRIYEGEWDKGKQHGMGKFTRKDGRISYGRWEDGHFKEKITQDQYEEMLKSKSIEDM